ncbi:glycosyltransferase [bacterium]|nr:glycosyltransferase [candidate division CSSED10-310 bacterium]
MAEPITVAIINYNGADYLEETVQSILDSDYPDLRLMLVDDVSTDDSVTRVRHRFPKVRIVQMEENVRFRGRYPLANRVRNRALREADTRLVFLADNDIVMDRNCLREMADAMDALPDCAVCTPRILTRENPDRIYSDGTELHYACATISRHRGASASEVPETPKPSLGCGIQLLDREKALEIGGMNEDYVVGWGDDGEFHQRMNMSGYRVFNIPSARVYHPSKTEGFRAVPQVKNRLYFIWHMYAWRTLLLAAPALWLYDLMLFFFLVLKGGLKEYVISVVDFWRHFGIIMVQRRRIQKRRTVADRSLMTCGPIYVAEHLMDHPVLGLGMRMINGAFRGYWVIIKRWI